jgi:small-conductance mechanosensitive channel/CRP-like cAMP-binding protein
VFLSATALFGFNPAMNSMLSDPIVQFYIFLCVAIVLSRLFFRGHPTLRLVGSIVFFGLITAFLLYHGIEPYSPDSNLPNISRRIFVGLAKVVWWIGGALVLTAFVRMFLIFERIPREGRLLQDLVVGIIYLGAGLSVVAYVFSVPVGTLIATSGVFALILGLALQSTLNDVFSGIALNLGRAYTVGDWIVLENDVQGRVIETNWRATHLLNGTNDLVIIPNSTLAKARLTNLSSPDETHGISLTIRVVPVRSPAAIESVMQTVLLSSNSILKSPAPSVTIKALENHAVEVELSCRVKDTSATARATNEIYDLLFRHCKAAGLPLAAPAGIVAPEIISDTAKEGHPGTAWRLLNAISLFAPLTEDEKEALSADMTRLTFRKDSIIVEQGTKLSSLMIVRSGVAVVSRRENGRDIELARLSPGDCFGEGGVLMDTAEIGSIRAMTFVVAYQITRERLACVMRDRPVLADDLGILLARRQLAEQNLIDFSGNRVTPRPAASFATRIRHLFELQHEG